MCATRVGDFFFPVLPLFLLAAPGVLAFIALNNL